MNSLICLEKGISFLWYSYKNASLCSDHDKTSEKPELNLNNRLILFKRIKAMKDKKRLRKYHRLDKAKKKYQFNAILNPKRKLVEQPVKF